MFARRLCLFPVVLGFACTSAEAIEAPTPLPSIAVAVDSPPRQCDFQSAGLLPVNDPKNAAAAPAPKAKAPPPTPPAAAPPAVEEVKEIVYEAPFNGRPISKQTTATGLQIEDFVIGTGALAASGNEVTVHYTGWTSKGTKFDSSKDRNKPITLPIGAGSVIKGWDEGIVGMKAGGKRRLTIPPALGYAERGFGGRIPPNSTLVFTVELLDTKPPPPPPEPDTAFAGAPIKTWKTPEGIEVLVYREGTGPGLAAGQEASIHYTGTLDDKTVFDSSVPRKTPFKFPLGQGRVIKGWDLGAQGMKVGELRKLVIPAELAYGDKARGKIPANSRLTFTMQLMGIS